MRMIALALTLATLNASGQDGVPPEKLTAEALHAHVKKYLADPKRREDLKEFEDKLVLSTDGLTLARKGSRYEVVWAVTPKERTTLDDTQMRLLRLGLEDTLRAAVTSGALLEADAGVDYRVRIGSGTPPPAAAAEPTPAPQDTPGPVLIPAVP
ncbi:MAG: hypothetical protein ACRC33_07585, partial [Gemmataceae bacterium]